VVETSFDSQAFRLRSGLVFGHTGGPGAHLRRRFFFFFTAIFCLLSGALLHRVSPFFSSIRKQGRSPSHRRLRRLNHFLLIHMGNTMRHRRKFVYDPPGLGLWIAQMFFTMLRALDALFHLFFVFFCAAPRGNNHNSFLRHPRLGLGDKGDKPAGEVVRAVQSLMVCIGFIFSVRAFFFKPAYGNFLPALFTLKGRNPGGSFFRVPFTPFGWRRCLGSEFLPFGPTCVSARRRRGSHTKLFLISGFWTQQALGTVGLPLADGCR